MAGHERLIRVLSLTISSVPSLTQGSPCVTYAGAVTTRSAAGPSTRERILDAAMDLFAQEGFMGTTITDIERRVGPPARTGSLYRHLPSKEALLDQAAGHPGDRLLDRLGGEL